MSPTNQHHRTSIRLAGYDYTQNGYYFVTLVTFKRTCVFGKIINGEMELSPLGQIAKLEWLRLPSRFDYLSLDEYTIMPNHIHGIIIIQRRDESNLSVNRETEDKDDKRYLRHSIPPHRDESQPRVISESLGALIRAYKSSVTFRSIDLRTSDNTPLWQRNYFERILGTQGALDRTREYIQVNPIRWADDPENDNGNSFNPY